MAGPVPAIHVFDFLGICDGDARDKRGHDGVAWTIVMAGLVPAIHVFDFLGI
jgi:hypothetical protein